MRRFLFYVSFIFFMIKACFYRIRLEKIKKKGTEEEVEAYINKRVLQWANFTVKGVGIKLDIKGRENLPDEPCLYVSNHQGNFDVPSLICAFNKSVGFVAKIEMEKIPVLSYWMRQIKCVFINRQNPREGIKAIKAGAEYLKNGSSMLIFPEGTRSRGNKLGEFKKGSLKMGLKAGVPIVPVTIDGTYKSLEEYDKKSKEFGVKVIIDKPIQTKDLSKEEIANLTDRVRDIIEKNLEKC